MKVSVNWLKQFMDFDLPPTDELVEKIGAQLGAVEEVIDLGKKYRGIVIAKVVECEKLEGSDHLSVCKIDDGGKTKDVERDSSGHVQVICGAPNCRANLTVAWLPPGTIVPSTADKEPFVLEVREIRGHKSNGMLVSPAELAISDNHGGILELNPHDADPGADFAKTYKLDDCVIDIENKMFTHRPDCFGALGVAREVAGILGRKFTSPEWYKTNPEFPSVAGDIIDLKAKNELPELVPRFTAIAMGGIQVGPSPTWLQVALAKVGQKSINNIVDLTNFYMLVSGQPLHAYDADKLNNASLEVRRSRKGDKLKLLNGKEVTLENDQTILITSGDKPVGIGGVMGGSETEVGANTKNIVLECATFDMYSVRRTSMELGLFTDAVTRFSKGQSPLQNLAVLAKIVDDIGKLAGGKVASGLVDEHKGLNLANLVTVKPTFVNDRLGEKLNSEVIAGLLKNVEFEVGVADEGLSIQPPFWRMDIEIPEDIVEEVGRLHGYDKLPLELPRRSITPAQKSELLELKNKIRGALAKNGANEVLTYSFVHGNLLGKAGQDPSQAFQLSNAISPDLQFYRLSLTPSLLDKIHPNIKAGYDEFAVFELGKAHIKGQNDNDDLPREDELIALVVAAADKLKKPGAAYFVAKKYLETLVETELTYKPAPEAMRQFDIAKPFDMDRTAFVYAGETFLGLLGEFRQAVIKNFKLPVYCAGFELDTAALAPFVGAPQYVPLPRFPKVTQDITLKVAADLPYAKLFYSVSAELESAKPKNSLATLEPLGIYQGDNGTTHKQITFRLNIACYERTLTDAEVNKLLDKISDSAKQALGTERV